MEKTANSLDEAMKQLDETGLTFGSKKPKSLWRFQENGLLPHEDIKLESERPLVSEEIIRELNPHNASNSESVEVSNDTVNDEDGWTSMEIATHKEVDEPNNSEEDLVGNDPRMAIDAELAKLDHAWERRNINSEEEEEDPLNELNNEFENFDI